MLYFMYNYIHIKFKLGILILLSHYVKTKIMIALNLVY